MMNNDQAVLSCESLQHIYHSGKGVRNLTIAIKPGELVVILGPNGAGKSTFVKLLAGVLPPQNGNLFVNGNHFGQYTPKKLARLMAYVPQKISTIFSFTVEEFVLMGRAPYLNFLGWAKPADYAKVYELLQLTHTLEFKDRMIGELSGGELQRVFLAQALVQETQVLLLDEPLTHLDLAYQMEFMELLKHANTERGLTIILVLHDINLAAQYASRLLLMRDGAVVEDGEPQQLFTKEIFDKLYGTELLILQHPVTGKPFVLPVPPSYSGIDVYNQN